MAAEAGEIYNSNYGKFIMMQNNADINKNESLWEQESDLNADEHKGLIVNSAMWVEYVLNKTKNK